MDYAPISQVSAASTWNTGPRTTGSSELGRDAFLKILIAQLQHQDPLSPADPQEFAAQLAQFSSLEQMMNMNSSMQTLAMLQASMNNAQTASFIGRQITAHGTSSHVGGGTATPVLYNLGKAASHVTVEIRDANNKVVRTETLGSKEAGQQRYEWDGLDNNGVPVADGNYTCTIAATDGEGAAVSVDQFLTGTVQGVVFENGVTYLEVDGQRVAIADVTEIH